MNWKDDLGAPAVVTAAKWGVSKYAVNPLWDEGLAYAAALGGYVAASQRIGGDFAKNVGIAAFPWAAEKLINRVTGWVSPAPVTRRMPVTRYPAPAFSDNFDGVRLD